MVNRIDNRYLRLLAYLGLALAGAIGLFTVAEFAEDAQQAAEDAQQAVESADSAIEEANRAIKTVEEQSRMSTLEVCNASNENRRVILNLIEAIQSSGVADFSAAEGFEALPPELQTYLLNLGMVPSGEESRFLRIARELLVAQDCEAIADGGA